MVSKQKTLAKRPAKVKTHDLCDQFLRDTGPIPVPLWVSLPPLLMGSVRLSVIFRIPSVCLVEDCPFYIWRAAHMMRSPLPAHG